MSSEFKMIESPLVFSFFPQSVVFSEFYRQPLLVLRTFAHVLHTRAIMDLMDCENCALVIVPPSDGLDVTKLSRWCGVVPFFEVTVSYSAYSCTPKSTLTPWYLLITNWTEEIPPQSYKTCVAGAFSITQTSPSFIPIRWQLICWDFRKEIIIYTWIAWVSLVLGD